MGSRPCVSSCIIDCTARPWPCLEHPCVRVHSHSSFGSFQTCKRDMSARGFARPIMLAAHSNDTCLFWLSSLLALALLLLAVACLSDIAWFAFSGCSSCLQLRLRLRFLLSSAASAGAQIRLLQPDRWSSMSAHCGLSCHGWSSLLSYYLLLVMLFAICCNLCNRIQHSPGGCAHTRSCRVDCSRTSFLFCGLGAWPFLCSWGCCSGCSPNVRTLKKCSRVFHLASPFFRFLYLDSGVLCFLTRTHNK